MDKSSFGKMSKDIPNPSHKHENSSQPLTILGFLINCCFYMFVVPCRVKWDPPANKYLIQRSNIIHLVICGAIQIALAYFHSLLLVGNYHEFRLMKGTFVPAGFRFVTNIASICLWYFLTKLIWFNQPALEEVINITRFEIEGNPGNRKIRIIIYLV